MVKEFLLENLIKLYNTWFKFISIKIPRNNIILKIILLQTHKIVTFFLYHPKVGNRKGIYEFLKTKYFNY